MTNRLLRRVLSCFTVGNSGKQQSGGASLVSKEYWTRHNVTLHHQFATKEESLDYFHWRNDQYHNYIELMPVSGFNGMSVLDYGSGPGHDLIGFGTFSACQRLVGIDVSSSSVAESKSRLALHGINAETVVLECGDITLPFEDATFDHIHSSGVLHHTPDPLAILKELKRVLKPGGSMNLMVYNYDSLWVHLYVAYQRSLIEGLYQGESLLDQFRHSTDGENCPISNCYRPNEWVKLCKSAGLNIEFAGAAISMFEAALLPLRFAAIQDRRLATESRKFLVDLKFDSCGYPMFNGHFAGVDACYRVIKVD